MGNMSCRDTGMGGSGVRCGLRTNSSSQTYHISVYTGQQPEAGRQLDTVQQSLYLTVCVTWKTSVWLGLGCVCCSPACWEWCWFCHWDQTSLGRPGNWAPLWLLSPDTSGNKHRVTHLHNNSLQKLGPEDIKTLFVWVRIRIKWTESSLVVCTWSGKQRWYGKKQQLMINE